MKEISREWLKKAKDDLDVIKEIKNKKHLTNMVAFHAQQAIEKSLKAIIDEFDLGFVKIHQIERLLEIVNKHVEANIDHEIVQILDSLYIESRYPVDIGLLPDYFPKLTTHH
ncbi:MAG: HEPN domain-containing protein [Deltaproteobacteria bacterium]|nr:HEPN domain-containing protein [Deltaproteobacteria bacterium]